MRGGIARPARDRWDEKVSIGPGCWLWRGYRDRDGYGTFRIDPQRCSIGAHRAAWILFHGPVLCGQQVLHRCDNPPCVNPEHLFLGTAAENQHDRNAKNRQARGESQWKAKLNWADVLKIRQDRRLQRVIAAEYQVTQETISSVKRRKTWRDGAA